MSIKTVKARTQEDNFFYKRGIEVKTKPLFYYAHTREAQELKLVENCKLTIEKKLTNSQILVYNQIMEEDRKKNESNKKKGKKGVVL